MSRALNSLRARARALKAEVHALAIAVQDPRVPWVARAVAIATIAYALSPIDLIPDPIPVLGYLDDLILIPAGIALAVRLIPAEVMTEARQRVADPAFESGLGRKGAVVIVIVWLGLAVLVAALVWRAIA